MRLLCTCSVLSLAACFTTPVLASDLSGLWGTKSDPAETITLSRRLPPVAVRNGKSVKFDPSVVGASIPPEVSTILKEKIRTFLLSGREGGIQLVEENGDTILKCLISGYEPKVERPNQREIGNKLQTIKTYIGNAEASVQVLDQKGEPLDAAIVKHHLEEDFVVSQQEEKTNVTNRAASILNRALDARKIITGSNVTTGPRLPTDHEWTSRLIEGLAARVANRIVPVSEDFVIVLPHDKALSQARDYVKARRWGDVQENLEKLEPLKGAADSYRLYLLGISYEGLAYQGADQTAKAPELLNKASEYYDQAARLKSSERQFLLQQIRVRDSLDQYLAIQHYVGNRKPAEPVETAKGNAKAALLILPEPPKSDPPKPDPPAPAVENDTNASLVEMTAAGLPEDVILTSVRESKEPHFDVSGKGLVMLQKGKVSGKVITAVQVAMKKASAPSVAPVIPRRSPPKPPVIK